MKSEKKVMLLYAVTVAGAAISALLWLAQLAQEGWAMGAVWGAVVALGVLAAATLQLLGRKRELAAMEKAREESREEARQQREALRQEMEQFRSTVSHSMRMPISIIQGYADLLANDMVDDPALQKEYLCKISARAQYMSDVLRRQRLGGDGLNKSKLVFDSVDLIELVNQVVRDMQTAAEEVGIRMQVLSFESDLVVTADAYLLNRVFYNLLENALKYMGRSGVVTLRLARQEDKVVIQVQDDGVGMPADEAEHIFERNYQGSNRISGQGYGLFLVKESIEAHSGTVTAKSAPGQGMGITIHLPCKNQETT